MHVKKNPLIFIQIPSTVKYHSHNMDCVRNITRQRSEVICFLKPQHFLLIRFFFFGFFFFYPFMAKFNIVERSQNKFLLSVLL